MPVVVGEHGEACGRHCGRRQIGSPESGPEKGWKVL